MNTTSKIKQNITMTTINSNSNKKMMNFYLKNVQQQQQKKTNKILHVINNVQGMKTNNKKKKKKKMWKKNFAFHRQPTIKKVDSFINDNEIEIKNKKIIKHR